MDHRIKFIVILAIVVTMSGLDALGTNDIREIDFPFNREDASPIPLKYFPRIYMENDSLFICTVNGVYLKKLAEGSKWEAPLFPNCCISSFVRKGDLYIASEWLKDGHGRIAKYQKGWKKPLSYIPQIMSDIDNPVIFGIIQNHRNPDEIYAGFESHHLIRSVDFGESWQNYNSIMSGERMPFAISPFHENLFIESNYYDYGWHNISYSFNGEWDSSEQFLPIGAAAGERSIQFNRSHFISGFSFYTHNPDEIWFSGKGMAGYVDVKSQLGRTQGKFRASIITEDDYIFPKLIFDPDDRNVIYAPTVIPGGENESTVAIYTSYNRGKSWQVTASSKIDRNLGEMADAVLFDKKLIMYTKSNGLFEYNLPDISGIDEIEVDALSETEYYNLQGIRIFNPSPGQIIIQKRGNKTTKILVTS